MSTHYPQPAAGEPVNLQSGCGPAEALELMARALALLDANEVPADAGAHLDHAMHRLREWIANESLR